MSSAVGPAAIPPLSGPPSWVCAPPWWSGMRWAAPVSTGGVSPPKPSSTPPSDMRRWASAASSACGRRESALTTPPCVPAGTRWWGSCGRAWSGCSRATRWTGSPAPPTSWDPAGFGWGRRCWRGQISSSLWVPGPPCRRCRGWTCPASSPATTCSRGPAFISALSSSAGASSAWSLPDSIGPWGPRSPWWRPWTGCFPPWTGSSPRA